MTERRYVVLGARIFSKYLRSSENDCRWADARGSSGNVPPAVKEALRPPLKSSAGPDGLSPTRCNLRLRGEAGFDAREQVFAHGVGFLQERVAVDLEDADADLGVLLEQLSDLVV